MPRLDGWLEGFMHVQTSLGFIVLASFLLALRHASDPDHLAAVTILIASEREGSRVGKAAFMGVSWGLGHGTTLLLLGLPLVLLGEYLPEAVQRAAEVAIGVTIVIVAFRLLVRWRRGVFHAHEHVHTGEESHRHLHSHASDLSHEHLHATPLRTPLSAYGIGLVHGIGGSGGLTLLLLSTIPDPAEASGALLILAVGTAISMALLSTGFGFVIAGGPVARNFERLAPVLGILAAVFGVWYALGALGVVMYPF